MESKTKLSLTANFGSKDTPDPGAKHLKILHPNRRKNTMWFLRLRNEN